MLNKEFFKLEKRYLFSQIEERLASITQTLGKDNIINLGIGDVCKPICPIVKDAFIQAIHEMSSPEGLKGYGPALGYPFLREAICNHYYSIHNLHPDEIFITDGINSPITQILSIFDSNCSIAIPNPAYPVYLDNAIMKGFSDQIIPLPLLEKNNFNPTPPNARVDIVYLCSPGNPTGTAMSYSGLQQWIDWALENKSILLFDAAYSCFIQDSNIARSIFELEGAHKCAVEFMSFSKSAGFTGLRLGSVAMSKTLRHHALFKQYLETVSNGISYPVQKAGLAALSNKGQIQIQADIAEYKECARALKDALKSSGYKIYSGDNAPYLWVKTPEPFASQEYCNILLDQGVVAIAGSGFGSFGEGYFRLSCFITKTTLEKAVKFFKQGMVHDAKRSRLLTL